MFSKEYSIVPVFRHILAVFFALLLSLTFALGQAFAIPRLLVDMDNGEVLYAEEAGLPWHPASLTKLMTAFVAFEAISAGRVSLDTPVIMSKRALAEPPSKVGLPVDTAITMKDALYLLVVKSANDVAVAIAETIDGSVESYVAEMNRMAAALGLTATHYVNPNGLNDPGQVTSARDLAVLALNIRARHPEFLKMFATRYVTLGKIRMHSENDLLSHYAGTTGMKTGYICESGLNMVVTVERGARHLMAVVLGGSSGRERGELAAQLLDNGFSGQLKGNGESVLSIANKVNTEPYNMRPYICGKQAKEYVAARKAAFPMGLEGEPTYLDDDVAELTYEVHILGRVRDVPIPRPRPLFAPSRQAEIAPETSADEGPVGDGEPVATDLPRVVPPAFPRPRPQFLAGQ